MPLDASLEALTIVAPAARDGRLPTFEGVGPLGQLGVAWSDAAGRQRVTVGQPEASQLADLPEGARGADLLWWVEATAEQGRKALVAALPAIAPDVRGDAQVVTDRLEKSGKMLLWANTSGRWTQLNVAEPRRG